MTGLLWTIAGLAAAIVTGVVLFVALIVWLARTWRG